MDRQVSIHHHCSLFLVRSWNRVFRCSSLRTNQKQPSLDFLVQFPSMTSWHWILSNHLVFSLFFGIPLLGSGWRIHHATHSCNIICIYTCLRLHLHSTRVTCDEQCVDPAFNNKRHTPHLKNSYGLATERASSYKTIHHTTPLNTQIPTSTPSAPLTCFCSS